MPTDPPLPTSQTDPALLVREALAREYTAIRRAVAGMVVSRRTASRRGDWEQEIDDVLNETVQKTLELADRYEPNRPLLPWVVAIAVNVQRSRWKKENHKKTISETELSVEPFLDAQPGPANAAVDARLDLASLLERLPERERQAIRLRDIQQKGYDLIADEVGLGSRDSARVFLTRARQKLAELAKREEGRS